MNDKHLIELEACAYVISNPDFETAQIAEYIGHLNLADRQFVLKLASQFALLDRNIPHNPRRPDAR